MTPSQTLALALLFLFFFFWGRNVGRAEASKRVEEEDEEC